VDFIGVGGGQVGEGVEVVVEGVNLLLNRGEVNGNGDMDIGHLGCNFADRIKDNVVVMIREGGSESLDGRMDKKAREDEAREKGWS
jgi:hypothetical protein